MNLQSLSDEQLLRLYVREKCAEALDVVFLRHKDFAYRVAFRIFRRAADAEDAVQQAFIVVMNKAAEFHAGESAQNWLGGIVVKVALNLRRVGERRNRRHRAVAASAPTVDGKPLDRTELNALLRRELKRLPDHLRLPLTLRYFEGLSAAEVGVIMGLGDGTVRKNLSLGLAQLRRRMGAEKVFGAFGGATALPMLLEQAAATVPKLTAPSSLICRAAALQKLPATGWAGLSGKATIGGWMMTGISAAAVAVTAAVVVGVQNWEPAEEPTVAVVPLEHKADEKNEQGLLGRWTFEKGPPAGLEEIKGSWQWHAENGGEMAADSRRGVCLLLPTTVPAEPFYVEIRGRRPNHRPFLIKAEWCHVEPDTVHFFHRRQLYLREPDGKSGVWREYFTQEWIGSFAADEQPYRTTEHQTAWLGNRLCLSLTNVAIREITVRKTTLAFEPKAAEATTPFTIAPPFVRGATARENERRTGLLTFDAALPADFVPLTAAADAVPWAIKPAGEKTWGRLQVPGTSAFLYNKPLPMPCVVVVRGNRLSAAKGDIGVRVVLHDSRGGVPDRQTYWRHLLFPNVHNYISQETFIVNQTVIHAQPPFAFVGLDEYKTVPKPTKATVFLRNISVEEIEIRPLSDQEIPPPVLQFGKSTARKSEYKYKEEPAFYLPPPMTTGGGSSKSKP